MKDELGKLIASVNEAPLPWGKQQKLVDLFCDLLEKRSIAHKICANNLVEVAKFQQLQNDILVKILKGCKQHGNSIRRGRQGRKEHTSSKVS